MNKMFNAIDLDEMNASDRDTQSIMPEQHQEAMNNFKQKLQGKPGNQHKRKKVVNAGNYTDNMDQVREDQEEGGFNKTKGRQKGATIYLTRAELPTMDLTDYVFCE